VFKKLKNNLFSALLILAILLSIVGLSRAATPNPGHPWSQTGDGTFTATGMSVPRIYTFPNVSTTVLTTSSLVTVPQGGTGTSSLIGILVGNGTSPMTATTSPAGLLVGDTDSQTLSNKTINASNNTITDTSTSLGDLIKNNGTKFVRWARGTANQILRVNSTASNLEWATINTTPAGSNTEIQYNSGGSSFGSTSTLSWDNANQTLTLNGFIELATSSLPSVAATGTLRLVHRRIANRSMLMVRTDIADDYYSIQPSMFQQFYTLILTNQTTSQTNFGTTMTNSGTLSHVASEATGWMTNIVTSGLANGTASTGGFSTQFFRGSTAGFNGYFFFARVYFPDADYANSGATTGSRIFVGLTDQAITAAVGSDDPAGNRSAFSYVNVNGARTDTNWQFSTKDNVTESLQDTGVAFTVQKVYDIYMWQEPQGSTIYWRIDNLTDGTSTEGSTGTRLPTASTAMRNGFGLASINAVARNIRLQKIYTEVPR